jgi:hypothetical protein
VPGFPRDGQLSFWTAAVRDLPELLTLADVARILRCSKAHVCNAVLGRVAGCLPIPAIALGRRKLVRKQTLLEWLENNEHALSNSGTIPASPKRGAGKRA